MTDEDTKKPKEKERDSEDEIVIEADDTLDDSVVSEENDKETIKKLREKLKVAEKEKQEYLTGWQRAKADYINSRKEEEGNRKNLIKFANESFIEDLLPALDSFDMAMANKETWEKVDKNWRVGIEYIYNQILASLVKHGIAQENPVGEMLDITLHNPIGIIETEDELKSGMVAEVMQKGYTMHGKPIRPATVKVYELRK